MRERRLKDNVVVQIVLEVLCTFTSAVAVVDTKYLEFWPFLVWDSWCLY